ncbi:Zip-domain-containing protein [Venturia nashicola]|uniref:Zip-domain-containing protein n=1 Tax=Venturia nashicola TaxID=86259 RepID=A0A4Z1NTY8_9PEZI|nr:Zip-domain-containing protein [Venturia nashicola]TLD27672.1 Zip-domain-containing protein [Venturia nashicola]
MSLILFPFLLLAATSQATSFSSSITATPTITAVSECHMHETVQYCVAGTAEYQILTTATGTSALPAQYTGCHSHGSELFCISPSGDEVELLLEGAEKSASTTAGDSAAPTGKGKCHYHNGVEHCVGGDESEEKTSCGKIEREYNIPLRVGFLFVVLVTSGLGVFSPILLTSFTKIRAEHTVFVVLKQFGTGVIVSTAFIHLYTHANLMFENKCLGELSYESTTSAILLAGFFISFLIDYLLQRFALSRNAKTLSADPEEERVISSSPDESYETQYQSINKSDGRKERLVTSATALLRQDHSTSNVDRSSALNVFILEAGIVFHSVLIGLTLVLAPDVAGGFLLLSIVITFHQVFEGLALGTQIASLSPWTTSSLKKYLLATIFSLTTPVGMAIGISVLHNFNGNDKNTIIAIGTLDAFSAGILVWVGIVEMWAHDWVFGTLRDAPLLKTSLAMGGLVAGIVGMSVLGKWA